MARLQADAPFLHPDTEITESRFGAYVEIGRGSRVAWSTIGDYSYCDRYADIANAEVGKFANIAAFVRIGPTDHPMQQASLHHFLYRSADYWDDTEPDADFFAHRRSRIARIGHDTWIGHAAVIRPEVTVGHGAIVASAAVVTKDVAPYQIVAGIPARPIRDRFAPEIAERLMALAWWDWDHATLRARLADFRALPIEAFLDRYEGL
ncbi:chloramphenicol acetyltransferase [Seohaeicola zhoushanensis]|uniref:Acetyltransferase n=1 Tax=Seohaeicola zhoushanensis TaxID=1569283 RepID=A0A8J3M7S6_9RHOB|nr:chloramphenicol acetyltransferase [Seohaeicola zhoushanensis]GHF48243.1 acetyltransferase [Seohaeicola zhoushanensis]